MSLGACSDAQPSITPTQSLTTTSIDAATCVGVDTDLCSEVLAAALTNLARDQSAFQPPATVVQDACRGAMPDYADATVCWNVTLPLFGGKSATIVMARRHDGVVAQVGGDDISGGLFPDN